jgi:hypothetical protein
MDNDDSEYDSTETDWLAQCYQSYGVGYTKQQALQVAAAHSDPVDEPVKVALVEHVGGVTHSMFGWDAETFVSGEKVEIRPEAWEQLREAASETDSIGESTLAEADRLCSYQITDSEIIERVEPK